MKIAGTAVRFGAFALVLLLFTGLIIVVFGQLRFDRTDDYSAEFSNVSGLRAGQFVRAAGVEVGKVTGLRRGAGGDTIVVTFTVDRTVDLFESSTAKVRYADLIGNRFLEVERGPLDGAQRKLPPDTMIPLDRTQPALDLDALIGGFRPLFKGLQPDKVNDIAQSLITVLQGQGGTISDILNQTAALTRTLAERDQAIGAVIDNLNVVLDTTVAHQKDFDGTVTNLEALITGLKNRADPIAQGVADISDTAGVLADLLADDRPALKGTIGRLEVLQQPLVEQRDELDDLLTRLPNALEILSRSGGIYGDFFNFYLCDAQLKVNGLQPGGPVRTVRLLNQPTGRCAPR